MKAFHGKQEIKDFYLSRVRTHKAADEIIKGKYWENGRGCAVGCTIHSSNHKSYEDKLGIPEWLAYLEDRIFEELPNELSKEWPEQFLLAIKPGIDLNKIKRPFLIYVLEHASKQFDHENSPDIAKVMKDTILLLQNPDSTEEEFVAARNAAWAASDIARAAVSAATSAAWAAWVAARAGMTASDSASAAWAARAARVAWAAVAAADAAARAARAAWAAGTARAAAARATIRADDSAAGAAAWAAEDASEIATTNTYIQFSNELIRLIKQLGEQYGGS